MSAAAAMAQPRHLRDARASTSTCCRTKARSARRIGKLSDLPIVGDIRGDGYFYGIELVKDKATKETFDDDESERLLRGFLSRALFENGLYCRADDRGDPVVQLAPPLIVGQPEFDEIEQILRTVLTEAWSRLYVLRAGGVPFDLPAGIPDRPRPTRRTRGGSVAVERRGRPTCRRTYPATRD